MSNTGKNRTMHFKYTFDDSDPNDSEIMDAIEKWLPQLEQQDLDANDMIYFMIHNSSVDGVIDDYLEAALEADANADADWKFDPYTGKPL